MKVLIASRNPHKFREITAIFQGPAVEFVSLDAFPNAPEVIEDGRTFQENAVKKAMTLALFGHHWTLADDSGLEVDALGGAPGVLSARYAGEPADYEANNRKLLRELEGLDTRTARFRCVIALASPRGRAQVVDGACEGSIILEARGTGGFGYDPLFTPKGFAKTFAEMDPATKNTLSHRAVALRNAREAWGWIFTKAPNDWPSRAEGGRQRPLPRDPGDTPGSG